MRPVVEEVQVSLPTEVAEKKKKKYKKKPYLPDWTFILKIGNRIVTREEAMEHVANLPPVDVSFWFK